MVRPLSSTWMRSQIPMTTRILCSIRRTPQVKTLGMALTRCMSSSHSASDIPAAGSSSRTDAGDDVGLGRHADPLQQVERARARLATSQSEPDAAHLDVLGHRHLAEQAAGLKGAADACLAKALGL